MKKYLATVLLLTTILFTACAQQRSSNRKKSKVRAAKSLTITSVDMGRGACFGRCPTYNLIVKSNGLVRYKGHSFTPFIGVYEKQFPVQQTASLMKELKDYRIDTCSATYEAMIADLPGIFYKVRINGKVKEIGNAHFGPGFLQDIAQEMDRRFVVDNTWRKISDDIPD